MKQRICVSIAKESLQESLSVAVHSVAEALQGIRHLSIKGAKVVILGAGGSARAIGLVCHLLRLCEVFR